MDEDRVLPTQSIVDGEQPQQAAKNEKISRSIGTSTGSTATATVNVNQEERPYDQVFGTQAICWMTSPTDASSTGTDSTDSVHHQRLRMCPLGNHLTAKAHSTEDDQHHQEVEHDHDHNHDEEHNHEEGGRRQTYRTGSTYHYQAQVSILMTSLRTMILSLEKQQAWEGNHNTPYHRIGPDAIDLSKTKNNTSNNNQHHNHRIALSVIACGVGFSGGLCTPFVVEEYNAYMRQWQHNDFATTTPHIVQSEIVYEPLPQPQNKNELLDVFTFQKDIPMVVPTPGDYVVIVALQLEVSPTTTPSNTTISNNTTTATSNGYWHLDMANALHNPQQQQQASATFLRVVTYQDPPTILAVSTAIRYSGYAAIILSGGIIAWLLTESIRHRNSSCLQITQGKFLTLFLFAGLAATVSSFLLEPRNDQYCQVGFPMVLCSLQLFFAITLGRIWRINAIVSPAIMKLNNGKSSGSSRFSKEKENVQHAASWKETVKAAVNAQTLFFDPLRKMTNVLLWMELKNRPRSLRKSITDSQLAMVVFMVTMPQILFQVVVAIAQPRRLLVEYNDDESIGRQYCASTYRDSAGSLPREIQNAATNLFYYACAIFIWLLLALLIMARSTRKLPSLFNESKVILDSVVSSLVLLILGGGVIAGTRSSTSSPAVEYCVFLVVILCATLQASLRLMIPKLKMAWRNEQVVVSELVIEHSRYIRKKQEKRISRIQKEEDRKRRQSDQAVHGSSRAADDLRASDEKLWWRSSYSSNRSTEIKEDVSDSMDGTIWSHMGSSNRGSFNSDGLMQPPQSHRRRPTTEAATDRPNTDYMTTMRMPVASEMAEHQQQQNDQQRNGDVASSLCKDSEIVSVLKPSNYTNSLDGDDDESDRDTMEEADVGGMPRRRKSSVRFLGGLRDHPQRETSRRRLKNAKKKKPQPTSRFVISTNRPPEWKFLLKMMDIEKHFNAVNTNLLTGKAVEEDDWEELKAMTTRLGHIFENDVTFKWNIANDEEGEALLNGDDFRSLEEREGASGDFNDSVSSFMNESLSSLATGQQRRQSARGISQPRFLKTPREKMLDPECDIREMLAEGALRFAPELPERSVSHQVNALSKEEQETFLLLQSDWSEEQEEAKNPIQFSDEMILRFLRHHTGRDAQHHQLAAWQAMKQFNVRFMSLTAHVLEEQIRTKTIFPLPGLRTIDGVTDVFYMRPCRYKPNQMSTSSVINNQVYCMSTMLEKESACTNGIAFLACMDDWTMKHFSTDYCYQVSCCGRHSVSFCTMTSSYTSNSSLF